MPPARGADRAPADGDGAVVWHDDAYLAFDSSGELIGEYESAALAERVLQAAGIARRARGHDKIKAVFNYMDLLIRFMNGVTVNELVPLIEHEPAEIFWPIFTDAWPYCYSAHHHDGLDQWNDRLLAALRRVGPHHSVHQLSEMLTVYRGNSRSRIAGLSWTPKLKVARYFTRGLGLFPPPDPVIATAQIKRSDAFWYGTDEYEVIC